MPLVLALLAFVGFILVLVVVPLSMWEVGRWARYSCCPDVVLPETLVRVFFFLSKVEGRIEMKTEP